MGAKKEKGTNEAGDPITGAVAPPLGDYETCILESWRVTSVTDFAMSAPGVPIDMEFTKV